MQRYTQVFNSIKERNDFYRANWAYLRNIENINNINGFVTYGDNGDEYLMPGTDNEIEYLMIYDLYEPTIKSLFNFPAVFALAIILGALVNVIETLQAIF